MKYRYLKKSDIYKYLLTFLIFLVVISSASIWVQVDVELIPHTILQYFIWFLTIVLILLKIKNIRFSKYYYLVLIAICAIGYSLFNANYILGALSNVFIPLTLFYILGKVNGIETRFLISECFVNVMYFLAGVSLFFFITASSIMQNRQFRLKLQEGLQTVWRFITTANIMIKSAAPSILSCRLKGALTPLKFIPDLKNVL